MFMRHTEDQQERQRFSRRALLLAAGQVAAFSVLSARLYQLQIVEGRRFALLAEDNRINVQMLAPERGRILARGGEVLAGNAANFRAVLVPALAIDPAAVLDRLAGILGLSAGDVMRLGERMRRQSKALPIVIANDLSFEQVARLNLLAPELPGVKADTSWRRRYRPGSAMSHAVGYVGAPEAIGLGDDPLLRLPGMRIGKSGVERALDTMLRGNGGVLRQEVDATGRIVRELAVLEPRRGRDVVLSIDLSAQARVQQRLSAERRAAVTAVAVETGEVMVLASNPAYESSDISSAGTTLRALRSDPDEPLLNRATQGLYPPGSTFKMVTALAALEAGLIGPQERIDCEGIYRLADQNYRCWKRSGHGACDLHRAIRESCDVYFYEAARRIGIEAIAAMGRRLGLGQSYAGGIGLQRAGTMPNADWKRGRFGKSWYQGETVLAGIGQGYVLATPLQLAVMTARIASGRAVVPVLARPIDVLPKVDFPELPVRRLHLDLVRRAMTAVVNEEGGTGRRARLGDASGVPMVAGKTGTSQISRASTDRTQSELRWEERDHALFVAYVPADRPRYAVATVVEHGGGGGAVAAPLAKDVIQILLELDPVSKPFGPGGQGLSDVSESRQAPG